MKHIQGDLLEVTRGVLVHQVNLLGIMGGGIAYQIRERWPALFRHYRSACLEKTPKLGDVDFFEVRPNLHVANLFGQESIGGVATVYEAYDLALPKITTFAQMRGLEIYYPFGIGCGLAGGDWEVMKAILEKYTPDATLVEFKPTA